MTGVRRGCFDLIICLLALALGCTTLDSRQAPNLARLTTAAFVTGAPEDGDGLDDVFAYTHPGEVPQLYIVGDPNGARLPLDHTDVAATVRGHVAHVRVSQRFINDHNDPIEVTYTFPLPENSAVHDMRMVIGKRVIESEVHTRDRARSNYEEARADGHTAALLEQERTNIFTQSVANIAPGEAIEVEIEYLQNLTEDAGMQEFVFPMVVGPRFIPSGDSVPDASRITPPVVGEGKRSGNDVSLSLDVDAGFEISKWDAPTHRVKGSSTKRGFSVRLADAKTIPNRDFVIRWKTASKTPRASLLLGPLDASGSGHFQLLVRPPQLDVDGLVGRREMIFVIDRSGSMSGVPLALAKLTLREAIGRMRPVDTFDIVGFANGTERLFGTPRPANLNNLVLAERFIDGARAGGGTMMADAVDAALAPELPPGAIRYVFFLTDGYIGNEAEIFEAAADLVARAEQNGGRSRVFGIGIGSSPNRELIAGLSKAGDGVPLYVLNRSNPQDVVDLYYTYVDHAVLEDLSVDWGDLDVDSLYPTELPDLFASHSVIMHGRYRGKGHDPVRISARAPGSSNPIELSVDVSPSVADDRILSTLWAREKIDHLTFWMWEQGADPDVERQITELGLQHHLVTAYTSLVAIDRSRTVDGDAIHIVQPVDVPEDVDPVMSGAQVFTTQSANSSFVYADEENPMADASAERADRGNDRGYRAEFKLGKLRAGKQADTDAIARALYGRAEEFERCYVAEHLEGKRRIVFRITFDADQRLASVSVKTDKLEHSAARRCIETALRNTQWRGLPRAATTIEVELVLRDNR